MEFGFTLKPEHTIERTVALTRQAEAAGFDYGWMFDSHVLWRDPYPAPDPDGPGDRAAAARDVRHEPGDPRAERDRVRARDAQRDQRRPDGPRHRSRRLRPARAGQAADDDGDARGGDPRHPRLVAGRARSTYEGTELQLPVDRAAGTLPVWVAGYGPMALAMTGRVADGVILQLADPDLIRWFVGQVREAERAGRPARRLGPGPGRRAGPCRRPRGLPRADPLVPGARQQPRRRPRQQVPARAAARVAHRLRPRPRGLRLPPPRRGRLVERGLRRRRGHRPVLRPRLRRRARREAPPRSPTPASTSSTST